MPQRTLLIGLVILLGGCGNSLEETKKSLQGTWIAGAYLDTLESSRSPFRAARTLSGISDFHYDPARDSAVFGFSGGRTVGTKGITLLENGDLHFAGDSLTISFAGPRGADRMTIGTVELRRISHVAEMTIAEYLIRRLFAGTYRILAPPGQGGTGIVKISYGGAVEGLGDIASLTPVADYGRTFPQCDAIVLETLFVPDTLYYSWKTSGDTLIARWMQPPGKPELRPPQLPGDTFVLLRQRQ